MNYFLSKKRVVSVWLFIFLSVYLALYFLCDDLKKECYCLMLTLVLTIINWFSFVKALVPPKAVGGPTTSKYKYYKKGRLDEYQRKLFGQFIVLLIIDVIVLLVYLVKTVMLLISQ